MILNKILLSCSPKPFEQISGFNVVHDFMCHEHFYLFLAFLGGNVEGGVHILGGGVNLSSMLQQKHNDVYVAESRRDVKRGLLLLKLTFTFS